MNTISITALLENTCLRQNLLGQHGQSLLIEYKEHKYLFDTGDIYEGFMYNLKQLRYSLSDINGFIYSHKHLDHAGSLPVIIDQLKDQPVYILPDFGTSDDREPNPKYNLYPSGTNGKYNIALSGEDNQKIRAYPHTVIVDKGIQLEEGLFLTGVVEGKITEQAVVIAIPGKGIVVLVGCSHPKLSAMLTKAQEISNEEKIYGIIGGFHFKDMSLEEIDANILSMKKFNSKFIIPGHCTGYIAIRKMQEEFGDKVIVSGTGQFGTGNSVQLFPHLTFNFV